MGKGGLNGKKKGKRGKVSLRVRWGGLGGGEWGGGHSLSALLSPYKYPENKEVGGRRKEWSISNSNFFF